MKKAIINILYAILYSFIVVPVIGILTLRGYDYLVINIFEENLIAKLSYIAIAIILVIVAIYLIVLYLHNHAKLPIMYQIITGMIAVMISVWLVVYFNAKVDAICSLAIYGDSPSVCVSAMKNSRLCFIYAVYGVVCYSVYVVIAKMNDKKKGQ